MRIVVFNAGSASAKAALVEVDGTSVRVTWRGTRGLDSGEGAAGAFAELLRDPGIRGRRVDAAGHRVVHGGTQFVDPVRIDARVEEAIAALASLAPLHNPLALEGLRVAREHFPDRPMVAVFDTAFHARREPESLRYPLPWDLCDRLGLLRYGFHGIAHASLAESLAREQGGRVDESCAVTLQLGAGCSACAIENGRCVETSMGFSPLGGLPMATRSGDLDPAVALELLRRGRGVDDVEELLVRRSGFLGLANSADLREVLAAEARGDERARVAVALFVRRVVLVAGGYFTLLRGRGALVFGGGIGTHSSEIRQRVVAGLQAWGVELDPKRNTADARGLVSRESSRPVHVFETDEETLIARSSVRVLESETPDG
jgi:acetate kinase